jgi:hypothetical protein
MKEYITLLWRGPTTLNLFANKLTNKIWEKKIATHLRKHNSISCELSKVFHVLSIRCCFSQFNEIKKVDSRCNNPIFMQYPTLCDIYNHKMLQNLE